MNEEDYRIDDALVRVLETAIRHQSAADKACKRMIDAAENLERETNQLRNQIKKELKESINSATNQAANDLIEKFKSADRYAEKAAERYKSVNFWLPIKYFAIVIIIGAVILTGITKVMLSIIPPHAEINERVEKIKQMDSLISKNRIEVNSCDDRMCVKVNKDMIDKPYEANGEVYLILDGH